MKARKNQGRGDDVTRVYRSTADAPASESGWNRGQYRVCL